MRKWIVLLSLLAGCAPAPGSFVCEHCACFVGSRSVSHPLLCSTLHVDTECCVMAYPSS